MKSFVISVTTNKQSFESAVQTNNSLVAFGLNSTIFSGTDSVNAQKRQKKENRSVDSNYKKLHPNYLHRVLKPGVIGCFYSHYDLWKKCVDLNETILIFEDDVQIKRNFIPVDFEDVLILSVDFKIFRSTEEFNWVQSLKPFLYSPSGKPTAITYIGNSIPGTSGYSITPTGARKLLLRYKETYEAADFCINSTNVNVIMHSYLMGEPTALKSLTS